MIRSSLAVAALFGLSLLGPAAAATDVPLPPFSAIDLHGGGQVVLRHGPVQRVILIRGDAKNSLIEVHGDTLELSGCRDFWGCNSDYHLEVEIVTPGLSAMNVHGGGSLKAEGEFPVQNALSLDVHGGGDVDTRAIPVRNVRAEVHGGGTLHVNAIDTLTGEVHGGGDVVYSGHPRVTSAVHGGGSVHGE